mgnify:CR=1 FL=1
MGSQVSTVYSSSLEDISSKATTNNVIYSSDTSVCSMSGKRPSFEDEHIVYGCQHWTCLIIFDGHGGVDCVKYVKRRFLEQLLIWSNQPRITDDEFSQWCIAHP